MPRRAGRLGRSGERGHPGHRPGARGSSGRRPGPRRVLAVGAAARSPARPWREQEHGRILCLRQAGDGARRPPWAGGVRLAAGDPSGRRLSHWPVGSLGGRLGRVRSSARLLQSKRV